jgi:hypothetical protein
MLTVEDQREHQHLRLDPTQRVQPDDLVGDALHVEEAGDALGRIVLPWRRPADTERDRRLPIALDRPRTRRCSVDHAVPPCRPAEPSAGLLPSWSTPEIPDREDFAPRRIEKCPFGAGSGR